MTHRLLKIAGIVFLCPLIALLNPGVARAQEVGRAQEPVKQEPVKTESQIKAGALFVEARKLVDAGDYQQACPKFEQSLRLNVGIGVQFNLADCWEHLGRTASAQALFQGVAASARAVGQVERAQVAQARAEALEPRLVRMLIDVQKPDPALVIRRNRIAVEQKALGTATPVDAGDYLIEASAPGKQLWSVRVVMPTTASDVVAITIPPLVDATVSEPAAESKEKAPIRVAPAKPRAEPASLVDEPGSRSKRRAVYALTLAGFGTASVALGTILALEFKSKNDEAKGICPSSVGCSQTDVDTHGQLLSDAKVFRSWSFVGFGVGGAALVAATVFYLAPTSSSRASGLSAAPFVTADGSWGAAASGRF